MWLRLPDEVIVALGILVGVGWFLFFIVGLRKLLTKHVSKNIGEWSPRIGEG